MCRRASESNDAAAWRDGARELMDPLEHHWLGLDDRPMGTFLAIRLLNLKLNALVLIGLLSVYCV